MCWFGRCRHERGRPPARPPACPPARLSGGTCLPVVQADCLHDCVHRRQRLEQEQRREQQGRDTPVCPSATAKRDNGDTCHPPPPRLGHAASKDRQASRLAAVAGSPAEPRPAAMLGSGTSGTMAPSTATSGTGSGSEGATPAPGEPRRLPRPRRRVALVHDRTWGHCPASAKRARAHCSRRADETRALPGTQRTRATSPSAAVTPCSRTASASPTRSCSPTAWCTRSTRWYVSGRRGAGGEAAEGASGGPRPGTTGWWKRDAAVQTPRRATFKELTRFHTDDYINFLRKLTPESAAADPDEAAHCTTTGAYAGGSRRARRC